MATSIPNPSTFESTTPGESTGDAGFPTSGSAAAMSSGTMSSEGSSSRAADTTAQGLGGATAADRDVLRRVVQGAHEAVDRIADKAIPAVERLRGGVNDATERLQERASQVGELKDEWTESLRTTIRQHPLAAVATALAVGMILSRLTSDDR